MRSFTGLKAKLADLKARALARTAGPLVPIFPPCDGLPLPPWARGMTSEEAIAEVERLQRGEPSPYVLTPAQEAEISARFEAAGGVARVVELQRRDLEGCRP